MRYDYKTENTCAQLISFDIDGDVVSGIEFYGGCNGNLKAITRLVDGWTVDRIEEYLLGNTEVYYLKNASAVICSFNEAPKTITF